MWKNAYGMCNLHDNFDIPHRPLQAQILKLSHNFNYNLYTEIVKNPHLFHYVLIYIN